MVSVSDTLPHVQHVINMPDLGYREKGSYPGISDKEPIRIGATFAPDFLRVAHALTDGKFHIMAHGWDTPDAWNFKRQAPPGILQMPPHWLWRTDTIYMVPSSYLDSDNRAWHTLFHEAAHRFHLRPIFGQSGFGFDLYAWPRHIMETLADTTAYAVTQVLGIADDARTVANYRDTHRGMDLYSRPWYPTDTQLAANIAADIANTYHKALGLK